jgi:hypothetical protein
MCAHPDTAIVSNPNANKTRAIIYEILSPNELTYTLTFIVAETGTSVNKRK